MGRTQQIEKKMAVLQIVRQHKHILFDPSLRSAVNRLEKEEAWKEVLEKAQALGLANASRQWTYARDHIFGLWKSRTLAKREILKKVTHGSGGSVRMTEVDEEILEILGVHGADLVTEDLHVPKVGEDSDSNSVRYEPKQEISEEPQVFMKANSVKRNRSEDDSMLPLKQKLLECEIYRNKLEILKLERELGLPFSRFTIELSLHGEINY